MFHRFPELGDTPVLVRSLDLAYAEGPAVSHLVSAVVRGCSGNDKEGYLWDEGPKATFEYTIPTLDFMVHTLPPGRFADVPISALGAKGQWVDLEREGLTGLLFQHHGELR